MPSAQTSRKRGAAQQSKAPSFPFPKKRRTTGATDSSEAVFGIAQGISTNNHVRLLQLPAEIRLMIWQESVFVSASDRIVRPRQIHRTSRALKGSARSHALKIQTHIRHFVDLNDKSVPKSWELDLRKRERIDPLWPAFVCKQMYDEITFLYYSHAHYSLNFNVGTLSMPDNNILAFMNAPIDAGLKNYIGMHNAQLLQHVTLAFGKYPASLSYYSIRQTEGLTLPHCATVTLLQLVGTNVQKNFPQGPFIHCNIEIAHCTYTLTLDRDRRLQGSIENKYVVPCIKVEVDSSMYQTLDILHAVSVADDELKWTLHAFEKLFRVISKPLGLRDDHNFKLTREEWRNFLTSKTREMLQGDELRRLEGTQTLPIELTEEEVEQEENGSCEKAIPATTTSQSSKRAQSPLLDKSLTSEQPRPGFLGGWWRLPKLW